jgi:hypothetical protein
MRRGPIRKWQPKPPFHPGSCDPGSYPVLAPVSRSYPGLAGRLPTCYSPVRRWVSEGKPPKTPPDLHVLGTPPAFVLSQDQTLLKKFDRAQKELRVLLSLFSFQGTLVFRFPPPSLAATDLIITQSLSFVNHFFSEALLEFLPCRLPPPPGSLPSSATSNNISRA